MIAPTAIINGLGRSIGLDIIQVKGATGDYHSDYIAKVKAAIANFEDKEKGRVLTVQINEPNSFCGQFFQCSRILLHPGTPISQQKQQQQQRRTGGLELLEKVCLRRAAFLTTLSSFFFIKKKKIFIKHYYFVGFWSGYNFGFLHIKAVDDAGHDKSLEKKQKYLEKVNEMVGYFI